MAYERIKNLEFAMTDPGLRVYLEKLSLMETSNRSSAMEDRETKFDIIFDALRFTSKISIPRMHFLYNLISSAGLAECMVISETLLPNFWTNCIHMQSAKVGDSLPAYILPVAIPSLAGIG